MADFGVRFRVLRREHGYSQQKVAEMLGLSQSTIGAWETGRSFPDIDTAEKAVSLFGVTLADFFGAKSLSETKTDEVFQVFTNDKPSTIRPLYDQLKREAAYLSDQDLSHALSYVRFLNNTKALG